MNDKMVQNMAFWRQVRELRNFFSKGDLAGVDYLNNYHKIFAEYDCAHWRIDLEGSENRNVLDLLDCMTKEERDHILHFVFTKSAADRPQVMDDAELSEVAGGVTVVAAAAFAVAAINVLIIANAHTVANAVAVANAGVQANVAAISFAVALGGDDPSA